MKGKKKYVYVYAIIVLSILIHIDFIKINISQSIEGHVFIRVPKKYISTKIYAGVKLRNIIDNPKIKNIYILKHICKIESNKILLCGTHRRSYDSRFFGAVDIKYLKTYIKVL